MASSISQYGPYGQSEIDAANVIQKFWRRRESHIGMSVSIDMIVSLLGRRILAHKSRKKEEAPSLSINFSPFGKESPLFQQTTETLEKWIHIIDCQGRWKYNENLTSSWKIIHELLYRFLIPKKLTAEQQLQVVFDEAKEIQAVALFYYFKNVRDNENGIRIEFLCTAPHNLTEIDPETYTLLNPENKPSLRGCATALIEFIAFECLKRRHKSIYLHAMPSAFKFYEKLGFKKRGLFSEIMSPEAAIEFIHSKRCGRAKIVYDV